MKVLSASVTGLSGIDSITFSDSHTSATSTAFVTAKDCSLNIGDSVTVIMGYSGDTFTALSGYVKNIELTEPNLVYSVTIANAMIRAVDFFIAASDPETPFSRQNILAEDLVRDLMQLAGLNSFQSDSSSFTFAISNPVEINLTSVYDYCRFLGDIIAFNLYADNNGTVQFRNRRPYPTGGDTPVYTVDSSSKIINATYEVSDRDLRNRVIVYGTNLTAEASASSPYLPPGFYRSVVVAAPGVIDSSGMAQQAADYNLDLLNRLSRKLSVTIEGRTGLFARQVVSVDIPELALDENGYIYAVEHSWSSSGYITNLELRFF